MNSLLRGIKLSIPLRPTPKATLGLRELREISRLCDQFDCPQVYRAVFLLGFYSLLRISNIAPPFQRSFDPSRHLLRGDVKFIYPGAHLKLKWAKNIQAPEKVHWIKIPTMSDSLLCPVTALQQVLAYIPSSPSSPLFAFPDTSLLTQSTLRRWLASILRILGKPTLGHGFHMFRRSGASLAYGANVPLSIIQNHGLWCSDAIWAYISDSTSQSLQVPLAFQRLATTLQ